MSKSKSRQSSRQASGSSRDRANGSIKAAARATKTPVKVAVKDTPEIREKDGTTTGSVEEETSEVTTELATDDPVEVAEEEATSAASPKAATGKTTARSGANGASTSTSKESPSPKTGKGVPTTPASGKSASAKAAAKPIPTTPPLKTVPATPAGKLQTRDAAKYERRQAERQMRYLAERRARRNRILVALSIVLAVAIVGGATLYFVHQYTTGGFQSTSSPQGTYQEAVYNTNYPPVDSVYCDQLEQSIEHIHAYVIIYIDGKQSPIPQYVGIPQDSSGNVTCYYWLHTHDSSGIIHIESPSNEIFTFGQFRDEWQQQFSSLGFPPELLLSGWKIWLNGKPYSGTLTNVPLAAHNIITLAYNSPGVKPATTYNWNGL